MKTVLSLAALLFFSAAAFAQPYVFGGVGVSRIDAAGSKLDALPAFAGAGFRFSRAFAIEAVYAELGKEPTNSTSSTASDSSAKTVTARKGTWKGQGPGLFAVGFMPLSEGTSLFGRLGAHRLRGETRTHTSITVFSSTPGVPVANTQTDESSVERIWAPALGVGLQMKANDRIAIRAMLEQVRGHGDFERATSLTGSLLLSF